MVERNMERATRVRRPHLLSLALGLWIAAAPFVLNYDHTVATANAVVAGLLIAFLSYVRLKLPGDTWASWVLAILGVWLVLSPFIFGYTWAATYWNELLLGITLIILMFSAASQAIRHHSHLAH